MALFSEYLPKTSVSEELENDLFGNALTKKETEALRERCMSYQAEEPPAWSSRIFPAYAQYFGFLSSLKVRSVFHELHHYGYMDPVLDHPSGFQLVDFGAGTLGGTLGAVDFLRSVGKKPSALWAVDEDTSPMRWAEERFKGFLQQSVTLFTADQFKQNTCPKPTLFIAVDVLNEMGLPPRQEALEFVRSITQKLDEHSLIILIEPANKFINKDFLRLREYLKSELSILLPCTHSQTCPMLESQRDWCHEERHYRAPSRYWTLVDNLGFDRSILQFSLLVLGKRNSVFTDQDYRMVSRNIATKGKSEKWFCGKGERWKVAELTRHKEDPNKQHFFAAQRGDVLKR